jgi:RND family efflux transporter MFP subunit
MQGYKELRAPYAGIVSARNYDPGTLIPQATQSTGTPILTMGTITPMRVYADVPQSITPNIHLGDPATLTVREYPGRAFTGTVARRAEALQTATRTMLIEVDVDNADGVLYHGMYGRLSFAVALHGDTPQLPDDALIFRGGKVYVPVVRDNHLNLVEVALGYDDGRTVEVTSGIAPDDLVAINVGQAVRDGDVVQAVPAEQR